MANSGSSLDKSTMSSARFQLPMLDGLRAVAFMTVFLAHAGLGAFLVPGGFGVTVFFFLSGYLITTLLRIEGNKAGDVSLWNFYVRRSARILPPLYVTVLLVGLFRFFAEHQVGLVSILGTVFYVNNYLELVYKIAAPVHGLWSLAVEEHFYILFPLLFMLLLRRKAPARTQALILLSVCMADLLWRMSLVFVFHVRVPMTESEILQPHWTYSATDCRFDAIAWGCLLAVGNNPWFESKPSWIARHKSLFALAGVGVIIASLLYRNAYFRETLRYTLQSAALYPVFYYCLAAPSSLPSRLLSLKPVRWLGWISYSLYLIHTSFLEWLHAYMPPLGVAVCALLLSILYGWGMRVMVELPSHRLRDRFLRSSKPTHKSDVDSASIVKANG